MTLQSIAGTDPDSDLEYQHIFGPNVDAASLLSWGLWL